jgi:hypothetical protein
MIAVLVALLPVIGVAAVGVSAIAGGLVEIHVFVGAARKHVSFDVFPHVAPPTLAATLGVLVGWLASTAFESRLVAGVAAGLIATTVYLLALWIWRRTYLNDAITLASRGLRGAFQAPASD